MTGWDVQYYYSYKIIRLIVNSHDCLSVTNELGVLVISKKKIGNYITYFTIINYLITILNLTNSLTLAGWIYKDCMQLHKIYRIYRSSVYLRLLH